MHSPTLRAVREPRFHAMSKPFDAATRNPIEFAPADWLGFLGIPVTDPSRVTVIDSNLSTVTADADKVIWIEEPAPWIEHRVTSQP
jgi:hypothetical protein